MKCVYCGEFDAKLKISNPNADTNDFWDVCENCDKIIQQQMGLTLGHILKDEKLIEKCQKKIDAISLEAGLESFSIKIAKKRKVTEK